MWRWTKRLAGWAETAAVIAVLAMLAMTVIDVVGAKVFLKPLRGSTELVGFAQLVAMTGGMAMASFAGRHVALEFVTDKLPKPLQRVGHGLVALLGLGLFAILSWQSMLYGRSLAVSGQIASTAGLPFYPFAYALGVFMGLMALYHGADLVRALAGVEFES